MEIHNWVLVWNLHFLGIGFGDYFDKVSKKDFLLYKKYAFQAVESHSVQTRFTIWRWPSGDPTYVLPLIAFDLISVFEFKDWLTVIDILFNFHWKNWISNFSKAKNYTKTHVTKELWAVLDMG